MSIQKIWFNLMKCLNLWYEWFISFAIGIIGSIQYLANPSKIQIYIVIMYSFFQFSSFISFYKNTQSSPQNKLLSRILILYDFLLLIPNISYILFIIIISIIPVLIMLNEIKNQQDINSKSSEREKLKENIKKYYLYRVLPFIITYLGTFFAIFLEAATQLEINSPTVIISFSIAIVFMIIEILLFTKKIRYFLLLKFQNYRKCKTKWNLVQKKKKLNEKKKKRISQA